jgi:hypothetical protein
MSEEPKKEKPIFSERSAVTLGEFIQALVDGGNDQIIVRNLGQSKPLNEKGEFAYQFEVMVVPTSEILKIMKFVGCEVASDTLIRIMASGAGGVEQAEAFRRHYPEITKDVPRGYEVKVPSTKQETKFHQVGTVFVGKN